MAYIAGHKFSIMGFLTTALAVVAGLFIWSRVAKWLVPGGGGTSS